MSLTKMAFQIISIFEKVIPPPFTVNVCKMYLSANSLYSRPVYRRYRAFSNLTTLLIVSIIILRLVWLIFHWKSFTCHNIEQLIVYGMGLILGQIYLTVYQLFRYKSFEITNTINHACNLKSRSDINLKISLVYNYKNASIQDIFVLSFTFGFALVLPVFFCIPFALRYLPFQLVFGSNTLIYLCEGILYSICATNGTFPVLYTFLVILIFIEQLYTFTATLLEKTYIQDHQMRVNLLFKRLHKLRIAQILNERCNYLFSTFSTNLVLVGVLLASCGAFGTLKMYTQLNLVSYLLFPTITIVCVVTAIVFTHLFGLPYEHSRKFRTRWHLYVTSKYGKKVIQSCQPFGYQIGPYGTCANNLGIMICDDIIHCTVNVLLLA